MLIKLCARDFNFINTYSSMQITIVFNANQTYRSPFPFDPAELTVSLLSFWR